MKVLIVDDHVLIREALRGALKEIVDDAAIIEAPDSARASRSVEENPDIGLILLDLYLPDGSGLDFLAELREHHPAIAVAVLSGSDDRKDIARALELGAAGFIPKSIQREVMLGALKLIFSGGVYIPPEFLGRSRTAPTMPPRERPPSATELGLTRRQMEVLTLMMEGKSNKAICRVLDMAEPTVKNHVTAILKALNVTNRTEAVIAAGALGLGRQRGAG
ncbi:response regulator [Nitratireductor luteus]|uniref:response regulator n=1 Tax=Nitratireductor luteus TaxID=2976980 RepID=UPI00223EC151|nr:response regulator transcription factor [Nitratireductor luteus]